MKKRNYSFSETNQQYSEEELAHVLADGIFTERYLYFVLDSRGGVVRSLNTPMHELSSYFEEIMKERDLGRFYDLTGLDRETADLQIFYQKVRSPWRLFTSEELFTSLPQTVIVIRKIGKERYFGRVSISNIMPNVVATNIAAFIYVDMKSDRLAGFSPSFYQLFRDIYRNPDGMLDKPVGSFFSPSPAETQKEALDAFSPAGLPPPGCSRQVYSRPALNDGGPLIRSDIFTLPDSISTLETDFRVSMRFESRKGFGPYFILGEEQKAMGEGLDSDGYLLGRDNTIGFPIIKKNTYVAASEELPPGQAEAEKGSGLEFIKIGGSLLLFENGKRLAAYYDSDFLHRADARVSVGVRKGYECRIEEVLLETWPAKKNRPFSEPVRTIIKIAARNDKFFTLDRFYNRFLANPDFFHIRGYLLNDISEMKGRIDLLHSRYVTQRKREEKFKRIIQNIRSREPDFVGSSAVMASLKETARTVAGAMAMVLIEGPTGSGKEVLAHFIHRNSARGDKPFIKVDCSTVPPALIESHLFGHEKGAFTGAVAQNIGMFEKAHRGTLFLDEAGNLTLDMQVKLLRFFNDLTLQRVGGNTPISLDVRCLFASNTPLNQKVAAGTFREDLYYRINVVRLEVPPLRDHPEDIPELCTHFLDLACIENKKEIDGFEAAALRKLVEYPWPGNIRELRNVISRAVIFCEAGRIGPDLLSLSGETDAPARGRGRKKRTHLRLAFSDRSAVIELLRRNKGVIVDAAKEIGVDRRTLYNYINREKIGLSEFRKGLA